MNIKGAVDYYNQHKEENEKKMTMIRLALEVMPEPQYAKATAKHNMSMWNSGMRYCILKASILKKMCDFLKVDADFLFIGVNVDGEGIDDADISGVIKLMKRTGMKPNDILQIEPMDNGKD